MDLKEFQPDQLDDVVTYFGTRKLFGPEYFPGDRYMILQRWILPLQNDRDKLWLAWDDKKIIGHVLVRLRYHGDDPFDLLSIGLVPDENSIPRLRELLNFGLSYQSTAPNGDETVDVYAWSKHDMVDLLAEEKFVEESRFAELVRPIDPEEPEAKFPDGIYLRRSFCPTEARLWMSISERCFSRHFGYMPRRMPELAQQLSQATIDEDGEFWLAMLGERPLGMLRVRLGNIGEGYIEELGVDPEVRGYGLGSSLMQHAHKRFSDSGAIKARLLMVHDNQPAMGLYKSLNFEKSGTIILFKKKTR